MRRHPRRTETDSGNPQAWGTCDRSGFVAQQRNLRWQYEWSGTQLVNRRFLVAPDMYDEPQRQLGTIIIPPDPLPIMTARPEAYNIEEMTFRITQTGQQRYTMDGTPRVESNLQGTQNAGTYPG